MNRLVLCFLCVLSGATLDAGAAERKKSAEKKPPPPKPEPKKPQSGLPTRPRMSDADRVALLKPYDKNGDYQIDVVEFTVLEADFKKKPSGPLKEFDKGRDGTLDAMMDRTFINTSLGGAAPKNPPGKKSNPPAPPKPAPPAIPAPEKPKTETKS